MGRLCAEAAGWVGAQKRALSGISNPSKGTCEGTDYSFSRRREALRGYQALEVTLVCTGLDWSGLGLVVGMRLWSLVGAIFVNLSLYCALKSCLPWRVRPFRLLSPMSARGAESLTLLTDVDSWYTRLRSLARSSGGSWQQLPNARRRELLDHLGLFLQSHTEVRLQTVSEVVWCLGKLRTDAHCLSPALSTQQLWEVIGQAAAAPLPKREASKLLHGLAGMLFQWSDAPAPVASAILTVLSDSQQLPVMNELEVCNVIYALGKMGVRWGNDLSETLREQIVEDLLRVIPFMGHIGLSNVIWGLGKMAAPWANLPVRLRIALVEQLTRSSRSGPMNAQAFSKCVVGMSRMDLRLPQTASSSLLPLTHGTAIASHQATQILQFINQGLPRALASKPSRAVGAGYNVGEGGIKIVAGSSHSLPWSPETTEQTLATVVWSLGSMHVDFTIHLDSRSRDSLAAALLVLCPSLTDQGLSSCIHGLAKMKWGYRHSTPELRHVLEQRLSAWTNKGTSDGAVGYGQGQAASNILWGLGQFRASLIQPESDTAHVKDARAVAKAGLGDSNFDIREGDDIGVFPGSRSSYPLSAPLSSGLLQHLVLAIPHMNEQGVSNSISGLANLGVSWARLPIVVQGVLFSSLERTARAMPPQAVSTSLWALGAMGLKVTSLTSQTVGTAAVNALMGAAQDCAMKRSISAQSIAVTLYAFALLTEDGVGKSAFSASRSNESLVRTKPLRLSRVSSSSEPSYGKPFPDSPQIPLSPVVASMCASFGSVASDMHARELAVTLYSLGRLAHNGRLPLGVVNATVKSAIYRSIDRTFMEMTAQDLGNTIWGLCGQLGIAFVRLPPLTQAALTSAITNPNLILQKKALAAIFTGLSRRVAPGANWKRLDPALRAKLLSSLERVVTLPRHPSQNPLRACIFTGNVLYALGRLEASWGQTDMLNASFRSRLLACLPQTNLEFGETNASTHTLNQSLSARDCGQPVSFALNGLARMCFWEGATSQEKELLLGTIRVSVPYMTDRQVANTFWSLGRMGVEFGDCTGSSSSGTTGASLAMDLTANTTVADKTLYVLLDSLAQSVKSMSGFEFAWSLWALARCKVAYGSLTPTLRALLVTTACERVPNMAPRELGVALWALGKMRAPVAALPPTLIDLLFAGIETLAVRRQEKRRTPN